MRNRRRRAGCALPAALLLLVCACSKETRLRRMLKAKTGAIELPQGEFRIEEPLVVEGARDLILRGNQTRLRVHAVMDGALIVRQARNVRVEGLAIEGFRGGFDWRQGLPPDDVPMARWTRDNGVLVVDSEQVLLRRLSIRRVAGYGVLVNRSRAVALEELEVADSGSVDARGRNNATGGILFEEGCEDFAVRRSKLRDVRGNGIWTHSLFSSPRNRRGEFLDNDIRNVGRDALQAGHAADLRIVSNRGAFIGYPPQIVDVERGAVPVAIDTAGDVSTSLYAGNHFEEVNGKCIDLDGFHDGVVRGNTCINRRHLDAYPHGHYAIVVNNSHPAMESRNIQISDNHMHGFKFGGLFLIGEAHRVTHNVFSRLNLAHCNDNPAIQCVYQPQEPDLLRSGIYLGRGAHRPAPARNNLVEGNVIEGYGMANSCIGYAPGVARQANRVLGNRCFGEAR